MNNENPAVITFSVDGNVPNTDMKWWKCSGCGTSTAGIEPPTSHVCKNPNGCGKETRQVSENRILESDKDLPNAAKAKCASVTDDSQEIAVETRLTAEQLQTEANDLLRRLSREVFEDGINIEQLPHAVDLVMSFAEEAFKKGAEAFRDKSESTEIAKLNNELVDLIVTEKSLRKEIKRLGTKLTDAENAWKISDAAHDLTCDKVAGLREEIERLKRQLSLALKGEDDALRACREKGK